MRLVKSNTVKLIALAAVSSALLAGAFASTASAASTRPVIKSVAVAGQQLTVTGSVKLPAPAAFRRGKLSIGAIVTLPSGEIVKPRRKRIKTPTAAGQSVKFILVFELAARDSVSIQAGLYVGKRRFGRLSVARTVQLGQTLPPALETPPTLPTPPIVIPVPETTLLTGPPALINFANPSFTFSSSDVAATFECNMDLGAWGTCASPLDATGLAEGLHTFAVRAVGAGGTDQTSAETEFTVDTTPPTLVVTSPQQNGLFGDSYIPVEFSVDSGTTTCALNGGVPATCTSPSSFVGSSALIDGANMAQFVATDAAGNTTAINRTFYVTFSVCGASLSAEGFAIAAC